ncbi:MAG TPA: hypothetical protein VM163_04650 [bacterium]|nr:hypothetical protein [bacterium]
MKSIALSLFVLFILAASLTILSCNQKDRASDIDDYRPKILDVTVKQGETILRKPYVLSKSVIEPLVFEVSVHHPDATTDDPAGSGSILKVSGGFQDPDFGNESYQRRVEQYMGKFPDWNHTIGPINNSLARDSYLPGEVFYGIGFTGEFSDSGPGMANGPDETAGDGVSTIRRDSRLDPNTKSNPARPWKFYFWAEDISGNDSEPYWVKITITE